MNIRRRAFLRSAAAGALASPYISNPAFASEIVRVAIWGHQENQYRSLADLYEETFPGRTVVIEAAPQNSYHDRLLVSFVSGDVPDAAQIVDAEFSRFSSRGLLSPLNDRVQEAAEFDIDAPGYGRFVPAIADFFRQQGNIYALPAAVNPFGIGFNVDLFQAAGMPTPHEMWQAGDWTWERFVEVALEMDRPGQGSERIHGFTHGPMQIWNLACRIWANGGWIFNEDRSEVLVDSEEATEAIQWVFDLHNVHGLGPAHFRSRDAHGAGWLASGQAAMVDASTGFRLNVDDSVNWGVAPFPRSVREASWAGGSGFAIPRGAANPDRGWHFIQFVMSNEGARHLMGVGAPATAVTEVLNSDAFIYDPPQHSESFLHMLSTAEPQPFIANNAEYKNIWDEQMDLVALNRITAAEATRVIKERVTPLLGTPG